MTLDHSFTYRHLGGSLPLDDPTYVVRDADQQLYDGLANGEFCYVLNSRQMGKSSLRVRVMQRLQADGIACGVVDLSAMGTESTASAWYKGVAYRIMRNFRAAIASSGPSNEHLNERSFNWRGWWKEHDFLSPVQQLDELIQTGLLATVPGNIVIFIDEIDSVLSLGFSTDDFFSWIRSCHNSRADDNAYQRLTFCLLGVATPSDLITDKKRTPFNVGRAIALTGFTFDQAQEALQPGLAQAGISLPHTVLQTILEWTGGQPFLTQKLCQLVVSHWQATSSVEAIVTEHILTNWESNDEPEHLRTIRDRFYAYPEKTNRLLGLYQQILADGGIERHDSPDHRDLQLTGLITKDHSQLVVFNPIYAQVFNMAWVTEALAHIRPYARSLDQWFASDGHDASHLLTGVSLTAAKAWATGKRLSDQDYTYLAACQEAETDQAETALALEAQAKEVLAIANRNANRRIKLGIGILGIAATLLVGSLIFSGQTIQAARQEALEAQEAADEARTVAQESQTIAKDERQNAELARQDLEAANQQTRAANQTTRRAQAEAKAALADAETALQEAAIAEQTARQAQQEAAIARQDTESAQAETNRAIAQRQQAERQVERARANLDDANRLVTAAQVERYELTVGTQLERSAQAIIRQATKVDVTDLVAATHLGNILAPFLDGRPVSDYPAVAPLLALQTVLARTPQHMVLPLDTTDIVGLWFSQDASRYKTLHSYDGYRRLYFQDWTADGTPMGRPIATDPYGYRPLSFYLTSSASAQSTGSQSGEADLLAIRCGEQSICVQDIHQQQREQVPGTQAAFNPYHKEVITLDDKNVVRRWSLFNQGKWVGSQIEETHISGNDQELFLTPDGQYVWTKQNDRIAVLTLDGQGVQEHVIQPSEHNPYPTFPPVAITPSGTPIHGLDHRDLPGQGSQALTLPSASYSAFEFLNGGDRFATIHQNGDDNPSVFQIHNRTGQVIHSYPVQNKSLQLVPQPSSNHIATVECPLNEAQYSTGQDCIGVIWDKNGQRIKSIELLGGSVQWTPDGQFLATWDDQTLDLISLERSTIKRYDTAGYVQSFQRGPSGDLYFWVQRGGGFDLWHADAQQPITHVYPSGMNGSIVEAWYAEQQQTVLAVSNHVEPWAALIAQPLAETDDISEPIIQFQSERDWSFSPNGEYLAVSRHNGDLQLWSTDGSLLASFIGHQGAIDDVQFSPDGTQILTYSGTDQTARLWDLQGRQMAQYTSDRPPAMNTDWNQIMTLEQRPQLHPRLPSVQLNLWSVDTLDTLLVKACQRLAPYLSQEYIEERDRQLCDN